MCELMSRSSIISIHQFVCLCACTIMFYYYKSVVQLEIRGSDIFSSSFIIKDCFDGRFIESVD